MNTTVSGHDRDLSHGCTLSDTGIANVPPGNGGWDNERAGDPWGVVEDVVGPREQPEGPPDALGWHGLGWGQPLEYRDVGVGTSDIALTNSVRTVVVWAVS